MTRRKLNIASCSNAYNPHYAVFSLPSTYSTRSPSFIVTSPWAPVGHHPQACSSPVTTQQKIKTLVQKIKGEGWKNTIKRSKQVEGRVVKISWEGQEHGTTGSEVRSRAGNIRLEGHKKKVPRCKDLDARVKLIRPPPQKLQKRINLIRWEGQKNRPWEEGQKNKEGWKNKVGGWKKCESLC